MMQGRHYALVYALVLIVFSMGVLNQYPLRPTHESQFFLRGLTFSTLYKNHTLPQSLFPVLRQLQGNHASPDEPSAEQFSEWYFPGPVHTKQIRLEPEKRVAFTSPVNVARYPVVVFVPQILAGTLGDALELPPAMIFYLARMLCVVQALVAGCAVLLVLPAFHLPFLAGLLAPVTIMIGIQQYADHVMTLSSYLFLALVLRYSSFNAPLRAKHFAVLLATGAVLASSKLVYGALTLAVWLIPAACYASARQRLAFRFGIPALCSALTLASIIWAFWASYHMDVLSSQRQSFNPKYTIATNQLLSSPSTVAEKIFNTYASFGFWQHTWINLCIWLATSKNLFSPLGESSKGLYSLMMLVAFAPALLPKGQCALAAIVGVRQRLLLLGACALTSVLIALGLFIDWTDISSPVIQGIGGRYYIPLLPYMALALHTVVGRERFVAINRAQLALALTAIIIIYLSIIA